MASSKVITWEEKLSLGTRFFAALRMTKWGAQKTKETQYGKKGAQNVNWEALNHQGNVG